MRDLITEQMWLDARKHGMQYSLSLPEKVKHLNAQIHNDVAELVDHIKFAAHWMEMETAIRHGVYHDQETMEDDIQKLIDDGEMPQGYYKMVETLARFNGGSDVRKE